VSEHRQHRHFLADVVGRVERELAASGSVSVQSLGRIIELLDRSGRFVEVGHGVASLDEVTPEHARAFMCASGVDGAAPGLATQHLRRSAIRLLFRVGRELGLAPGDPTLDVRLPPRSLTIARPLSDEEVSLCRTAALHSLTSTRLAAAWALAEATARTAELSHLRVADLELDRARVWIHGSPRTEARWGRLSDWGQAQLERRVHELGPSADPAILLVYGGEGRRRAVRPPRVGRSARRCGAPAWVSKVTSGRSRSPPGPVCACLPTRDGSRPLPARSDVAASTPPPG